jgi:hypothetical protein
MNFIEVISAVSKLKHVDGRMDTTSLNEFLLEICAKNIYLIYLASTTGGSH